jgi:hypothetical protein
MAEYYAKSNSSLSFEVEKDDQLIGSLSIPIGLALKLKW